MDDGTTDDDSEAEPDRPTPARDETPSAEEGGSDNPALIEAPPGGADSADGAPVDNLVANAGPQSGATTVPVSSTRVEVESESGEPDPLAYGVFGAAVAIGALSGARLLRRRLPFEISVRRRDQ
jgi:hypothetical protein